ncbi:MAG TPA: SUF system Fe-S cluster assembly regulator [Steroidobacteraceae bacterium]|nr:SUF system Fe-S cluster assembly regulator [Steroidobacteraceae bacterium]
MLRISKLTDYATVILAHLADTGAGLRTAVELAEVSRIGVPTVSKVLQDLQRAGLVASTRGAHGGYALARPASAISAADIIDAVEGPVGLTECSTHPGQCGIESSCRVGHSWQRVNLAIRLALADITLTQLASRETTAMPVPNLGVAIGTRPGVRVRA